ncbi:unnamed protein product [Coffea canephora]|uniref:Ribosome-recycling factor, chloroplastic n=1 Tax=Coffea canephora TaxID=49390 RepID=A0A068V818_COFCA|nr:unnamed protein product [Coffea canephora]
MSSAFVRRSLRSYRTLSLLLRTSTSTSIQSRHHSYLPTFSIYLSRLAPPSPVNPCSSALNFLQETRRGYAKGRRQTKFDDDDDDDEEVEKEAGNIAQIVNIGPMVKATAVSQMEAAIDSLSRELLKLRTGRASAGMLDHIIVETAGVKMPLNRMAVVSVIDSKTLSVTPYDPNTLKELEKAIVSSPLGLNPKADNQRLIASIPPLTKEHMQAVCKVVAKSSEDVKQSIRRARQKALDSIKKSLPRKISDSKKKGKDKGASESKKDKDKAGPSFSEDDAKRLEKEIEDLTKKFIKSAEDICKAKEKEITGG